MISSMLEIMSKDVCLTLHRLDDNFNVQIVSGLNESSSVCLIEFSITSKKPKELKDINLEDFFSAPRIQSHKNYIIDSNTHLSIKDVFSSHLVSRFRLEDGVDFMDLDSDLETLSKRYNVFTSWKESAPAKFISLVANQPIEKVHNRLKVARRRELLPSLGQGTRFSKSL